MKVIKLSEYNQKMGILIDVRHPLEFAKKHDPRSINIYADKLIMNHQRYLNKDKTYYVTCEKGHLSKKVYTYLSYLGYKIVQVIND